jgi:hypothetical protein
MLLLIIKHDKTFAVIFCGFSVTSQGRIIKLNQLSQFSFYIVKKDKLYAGRNSSGIVDKEMKLVKNKLSR